MNLNTLDLMLRRDMATNVRSPTIIHPVGREDSYYRRGQNSGTLASTSVVVSDNGDGHGSGTGRFRRDEKRSLKRRQASKNRRNRKRRVRSNNNVNATLETEKIENPMGNYKSDVQFSGIQTQNREWNIGSYPPALLNFDYQSPAIAALQRAFAPSPPVFKPEFYRSNPLSPFHNKPQSSADSSSPKINVNFSYNFRNDKDNQDMIVSRVRNDGTSLASHSEEALRLKRLKRQANQKKRKQRKMLERERNEGCEAMPWYPKKECNNASNKDGNVNEVNNKNTVDVTPGRGFKSSDSIHMDVNSPPSDADKTVTSKTVSLKAHEGSLVSLDMAIVLDEFPDVKITSDQVLSIEEALAENFKTLEHGGFPQFLSSRLEDGAYIVTCANIETKNWVKEIVPILKPWENAKLWTDDAKSVLYSVKVSFKAPAIYSKTDPCKIIETLGKQNSTLVTSKWKFVGHDDKDITRQTFIVLIDGTSFDALKAIDMKPFLGFSKITISVFSKNDNKDTDVLCKNDNKDTDVLSNNGNKDTVVLSNNGNKDTVVLNNDDNKDTDVLNNDGHEDVSILNNGNKDTVVLNNDDNKDSSVLNNDDHKDNSVPNNGDDKDN